MRLSCVLNGLWRIHPVRILVALLLLIARSSFAQLPSRTEHFVPVDQLETVFGESSGVLLPERRYRSLLEQAEAAARATAEAPAPILIRSAAYRVKQADNHALVDVTLDLEQFHGGWQHVTLPVGNLRLERASIGGIPAVVGRESANVLRLFHQTRQRFRVTLLFSTVLGRVGSDRAVGFEVIRQAPVRLEAECPADRHLLLDGRRLQRPQPDDLPATYSLPVGQRGTIDLRWSSQADDSAADTLVFVRSDAEIRLSPDTLRWRTRSRLSVFGGLISQLTARVPSSLEITAVECVGLESWELSDDPDRAERTRLTLTWRQPFNADRVIEIRGVAALTDGHSAEVPALVCSEVTAHTGRLLITHEDQLRLITTTGDGVRQRIPETAEVRDSSNSVFDFWLQDFRLSVAVRPRDRELFSQIASQLEIDETKGFFSARVTVETLNAPLFEIELKMPDGWQLISVTDPDGVPVPWRAGDDSTSITVEPIQPVPAGDLLQLRLVLDRHIDDPSTLQQFALPVVRTPQASTVSGRYRISSAPDLLVAPADIRGLEAIGEDSGNIVFASPGTPVSGTLTVIRKPVRLSSRTEIRCSMDERQRTTAITVTIDVINGTTRTLQIRLPESTGDDLRFDVAGIGQVPGYESAAMSRLVPPEIQIAEATAAEAIAGFRLWTLTFDRRFAGAVTIRTRVQQPREGNLLSAPTVDIPGAVHQEGLIAFEASPDQQFDESDRLPVQGLRPADPSLVLPPDETSGRRIARVYQFVQPTYSAALAETRHDTQAVPSAVCPVIRNVSLLSGDGSTQRSCRIDLNCIGIQTLRFTLPDEDARLWSTLLNGSPVEVRRDDGDYLVAIPTADLRTEHVLKLLFETHSATPSTFTTTEHQTVRLAIDVDSGQSSPIDVMEQTWRVLHPAETLVLGHSGSFNPVTELPRPGWLQSLSGAVSLPTLAQLRFRGLVAGSILAALFLLTALIVRRRWVVTVPLLLICGAIGLPLLLHAFSERSAAPDFESALRNFAWNGGSEGFMYSSRSAGSESTAGGRSQALEPGSAAPGPEPASAEAQQSLGVPGDSANAVANANRPRRGSARLSVRVNLERPDDYQTTDFRSVGAGAASNHLTLVVRTSSQILMIRLLTAALVLIACWTLRHQTFAAKLGTVTWLVLAAVALVPVAPNQWQAGLDGVVLGTVLATLLWPAATLVVWIQNCTCCVRQTTPAGLLLLSVLLPSAAADDSTLESPNTPAEEQPSPAVVLPYSLDANPLTADKVFIPHEEFLKLYQQAHPGELTPNTAPATAIVTAAFYRSGERRQVKDATWAQSFAGRFVIRSFRDSPVDVRLPFRHAAVRTAVLNGQEAVVSRDGDDLLVRLSAADLHILDIEFDVPAEIDAAGGVVNLSVSDVPCGLLTFELPSEQLNVRVNGRSDAFRTDGATIHVPVTSAEHIRIEWQPPTTRRGSDTIVHSTIDSALKLNDQGLSLVAAVTLTCRQGSMTETELTLPPGYSVQSVRGEDTAGWSVEGTSSAPRLRIAYRSAISDRTSLRLVLFSRRVMTTERRSLPVPVLEALGVSRSAGTVCVVAGAELDVRTETLSGVSQINPSDAVLTTHEEQPLSPVLAWRFNRHPAEIVIRAVRVSARLTADVLHGVRLESERQLWTSSFDVNIVGAPRRRLDIRVPKTFLTFEVDCTEPADWYVAEADNDSAAVRTVSIQFSRARTGRVKVVMLGRNQRSTDRTAAVFAAPCLVAADEIRTGLSIWLDATTEIAGIEATEWSRIATDRITEPLRKLHTAAPDVSFTAQKLCPSPVAVTLRTAAPSVLCESVTVTSVSSASIQRTLALSWQISGSAASTFSIELPSTVADTLDFRAPGLRQEERIPLDNDRMRITFHLQYPVSNRFFAAGSGGIPLPNNKEFRSIPVMFVAGSGEPSPLSVSGQSHYWVIVNQSDGVLEAVQPQIDGVSVAADQLQIQIPEGFLEQSVAIRRITEKHPGSAWRAKFPEAQETSLTIVALARHVTVIADDGTWRSRHTLQVRNESRQFLPVRLPVNSRPLFCLVRGKPARIVMNRSDEGLLHLIPMPQSGEVGAPFEVQFAVAGTLPGSLESLRSQWQREAIEIPVPRFPEYRNNSDLGVTVSRNTWSVYVPDTWSTSVDDDPRLTNVRHADTASLENAVVLSLLDNSRSMLKQAAVASHSNTKFGLFNELTSQLQLLKTQRGNSPEAEQDLAETQQTIERYLGDNQEEQRRSNRFRELADGTGNTNLLEQAWNRNAFSNSNNDALIRSNTIAGIEPRERAGSGQKGEGDDIPAHRSDLTDMSTFFSFRIADEERSVDQANAQEESAQNETERPGRSDVNRNRSRLLQSRIPETDDFSVRDEQGANLHRRKSAAERDSMELPVLSDRNAAIDEDTRAFPGDRTLPDQPQSMETPQQTTADSFSFGQESATGPQRPNADGRVQVDSPPISKGVLSLKFDIPAAGDRLDFERASGNVMLTLNVRSSAAHRWLEGILWAAGCFAGLLVVLRAIGTGNAGRLIMRFVAICAIIGIAGWFMLPAAGGVAALLVGITSSVVLCGARIRRSFQSSVDEQRRFLILGPDLASSRQSDMR